jgi:hypothetical protein
METALFLVWSSQPSKQSAENSMTFTPLFSGGPAITMSPQMFTRPETPLPLVLTERDRAILHAIIEHQFLDTQMVQALMPGSKQKLNRRLQALFENAYLDRPKGQAVLKLAYGYRHFIYSIGTKGIDLFAKEIRLSPDALKRLRDRARKWRERTNGHLAHDLEISRFRVCLALALRSLPHLAVEAIEPPTERVNIVGESLRIYPDWSFVLSDTSEKSERTFYLEVDRGTMSPERFTAKLFAYRALWKKTREPFQVLIVIPDAKRRELLLDFARSHYAESRMFLFATFTDYSLAQPIPLLTEEIWHVPATPKPLALLDFH